mgnify:FL=1
MEYVYHYTSADGLKGILESKSLWATNAEYLNDFREIKEGIDTINSLRQGLSEFSQTRLEEIYAEIRGIPLKDIKNKMQSADIDNANKFLASFWGTLDENELSDIYTVSFTTERDSLNHWLTYGSEQTSYCIKFNKDKLHDNSYFIRHKFLSDYAGVIYEPTKEMLNLLIKKHLPEVLDYSLDESLDKNELNGKLSKLVIEAFNDIAFEVASIKNKAFMYEKEYRFTLYSPGFVVINDEPKVDYFDFIDSSYIDFIELENGVKEFFPLCYRTLKSGIIAPYRAIPFPKNSIEEIIVGPSENKDLAVKGLESLLSSLNFNVEVSKTQTSFRRI